MFLPLSVVYWNTRISLSGLHVLPYRQTDPTGMPYLVDVVALLIIGSFLMVAVIDRSQRISMKATLLVLGMMILAVIGYWRTIGEDIPSGLTRGFVGGLGLFFVARQLRWKAQEIQGLALAIITIGFANAVATIFSLLTPDRAMQIGLILDRTIVTGYSGVVFRPGGLWGISTTLAVLLSVTSVLHLTLFIFTKSRRRTNAKILIHLLIAIPLWTALFSTLSRGPVLSALLLGGWALISSTSKLNQQMRAFLLFAIVAGIAMMFVGDPFWARLSTIPDIGSVETGERIALILTGLKAIMQYPLGTGIGGGYLVGIGSPHNIFLTAGVTFGIPGLVLLVVMLLDSLHRARKSIAHADPSRKVVLRALSYATLTFLLCAQFEELLFSIQPIFLFWSMLGILASPVVTERKWEEVEPSVSTMPPSALPLRVNI